VEPGDALRKSVTQISNLSVKCLPHLLERYVKSQVSIFHTVGSINLDKVQSVKMAKRQ